MGPALLSLVISFLIACVCLLESAQAGGRVNSSDLHIPLFYYRRGWFKMKRVASHGCMKQDCLPQVTTGQEED